MFPQCWKNNEDSFYKMRKAYQSAIAYCDAVGDLEDPFEYCICYKNIISQATLCVQPTCLNRELRLNLLHLQGTHANLKRKENLNLIEKIGRQHSSLICGEFKLFRERIVERQIWEEVFLQTRAIKLTDKNSERCKNKKSRRMQLKNDMAQAEVEFEKARLKKLEEEEKKKENQANDIKPKKKGPKTHFRKSKKPGRA